MKKIFTLSCILAAALTANAQEAFKVSPDYLEGEDGQGTVLSLLGENLSTNNTYVSGQDQEQLIPFVWNVVTGDIKTLIITDDVKIPIEWDEEGNEIDWTTEQMTRSGSFHAVSPSGIAVGSVTDQAEYISYPVMLDATTGKHTYLYREDGETGGEGYGITDDSQTIVGFYFDAAWVTTPCLWTNGGKTRTDLPMPTKEEVGFPVDYASARWISPDGNIVLGYVQDFYSGEWVTVTWIRQNDGTYTVDASIAKNLYQPRPYTEVEGPDGWPVTVYDEITDPKPFIQLEPLCISDNGEWIMAVAADYQSEDSSAEFFMASKNIRYNVKTGKYDIIEAGGEGAMIEFFGIANDGTAVGRYTGAIDWEAMSQPIDAIIWPTGATSYQKLADHFADNAYVNGWTASALSSISADGKTAMGYASDEMGMQTTFVVELPALSDGIHRIEASALKGVAFDLQGRLTNTNGIRIINGKKVIK